MNSLPVVKPKARLRKRNALGKVSQQQIICAAEEVLRRDGYHGLSTRKVAQECGMSVGNLAYYFPSKVDLIEAMMDHVCERYMETRLEFQEAALSQDSHDLRSAIDWLVRDSINPATSALFVELWVLAKHHEFGARAMVRFYSTCVDGLMDMLAAYYSNAPKDALQRAAYFLLTVSEGTIVVYSRSTGQPVPPKALVDSAFDTVESILK